MGASLQSLASAHPRNFLLNSQAHLGMGENLARCHRGWHRVRKFLKIWSPRLPEMVFTAPHGGRLYKVVPRPHKTSTCSKLFACCGKCYLYICQLSLHTCTLVIFVRQVCTLAHLRFCLAHPRSRRKLPYSAVWIGRGCIFIYSCYTRLVMPDEFLLKSVVFRLISKEISRAEHEYINIHPPPHPPPPHPPPTPINALATALFIF